MDGAGWQITILIILVAMSAFFSGTETAFTSFNKTRMKTLAQDGNKKAKATGINLFTTKFLQNNLHLKIFWKENFGQNLILIKYYMVGL